MHIPDKLVAEITSEKGCRVAAHVVLQVALRQERERLGFNRLMELTKLTRDGMIGALRVCVERGWLQAATVRDGGSRQHYRLATVWSADQTTEAQQSGQQTITNSQQSGDQTIGAGENAQQSGEQTIASDNNSHIGLVSRPLSDANSLVTRPKKRGTPRATRARSGPGFKNIDIHVSPSPTEKVAARSTSPIPEDGEKDERLRAFEEWLEQQTDEYKLFFSHLAPLVGLAKWKLATPEKRKELAIFARDLLAEGSSIEELKAVRRRYKADPFTGEQGQPIPLNLTLARNHWGRFAPPPPESPDSLEASESDETGPAAPADALALIPAPARRGGYEDAASKRSRRLNAALDLIQRSERAHALAEAERNRADSGADVVGVQPAGS